VVLSVTDRNLAVDIERRQAIARQLVGLQVDIRNIYFDVYDSTVILGGFVHSRQERLDIVSCISRVPGVTRVIDSLTLRDVATPTYVYAAKGSNDLRRLTAEYLRTDSRWLQQAECVAVNLRRSAPLELVGKLRGALATKYLSAQKLFKSWMR
jgi:hypothetical protein